MLVQRMGGCQTELLFSSVWKEYRWVIHACVKGSGNYSIQVQVQVQVVQFTFVLFNMITGIAITTCLLKF